MQSPLINLSDSARIILQEGLCSVLEIYHFLREFDHHNSSWRIALEAVVTQNILDGINWVSVCNNRYYTPTICISYIPSVRYVARINHEARGRAAPEGPVINPRRACAQRGLL